MVQLAQNIGQRQVQSLAMTQSLQQSLKMLQMSSIDLADMIAGELEKNPLLSSDEASEEVAVKTEDFSTADLNKLSTAGEAAQVLDYDYSSRYDDATTGGNHKFEDDEYEFGATIEGQKSLQEDLVEQFYLNVTNENIRKIGVYMMDYLDDAGYFTGNITEIAETLGATKEEIEETLTELQKLEPAGIFARNLEECLKIQLVDKDRLDPCMFVLLQNLQMLAMRRFDTLQSLCGVNEEDLEDMVAEIKACNPKPALGMNVKELTPGQPDVFIKKNSKGEYVVELNNAALPKVLVNKKYAEVISEQIKTKQEKQYLRENLATANFLVKALDSRANTMLKTASAIVKHQEEFFKYGIKYLKPMTLAEIAEEIEMHESTVSRVTSNKYIQTPRGSFEMKYFFTSGVSNLGGEVASTSVKEQIKEIIAAEAAGKPYSDDEVTKILKKKGVNISRRTVMKYREALNIPSSYERKNLPSYL